ncbi:helix-turn-helix transcriptional regulator [Myxococcus eversor]|uniref:helix-turn-helix transcriptional regulator n=1 Tax=Myxococcus eversor TaxID=2709661 RepID=UPI001F07F92A|nr:helix-turn-helix domain-containing protein [Myxococcus eversor]
MLNGRSGSALRALEALRRMGNSRNPAIRSLMDRPLVPGAIVTAMRRDLVEDRCWYGSPYVDHYLRAAGLDDSVYSIRWSGLPREVQGLGIYRGWSGRAFDAADRELLHLFHAECSPLLDSPGAAVEVPQGVQLSRRERQTLELVLDGLGDKQIAERLGISRFTVNHYTKSIYRGFEVNSRSELIVRILGSEARGATPGLEHSLSNRMPPTSEAPGKSRVAEPVGDGQRRRGCD